jgi:glycosyltransferase involved in cell wall biosynthesis
MRVMAFTRYGRQAASTRQRFLQYFPALRAAGIEVEHRALLDDDYVASLATGEPYSKARVAKAYAYRLAQLVNARNADLYWVYVELLPFVPAFIERLAAVRKPVVYDFDDAFFHSYDQSGNSLVRSLLGGKHAALLRHAAGCACGNAYLRDFAVRHCPNSIILPTVVDTARYRPKTKRSKQVTIGWIGSPSTWPNVRPLLPLLKEFVASHNVRIRVVGAGRAAGEDQFDGLEFVDWTETQEIADVQAMDIGIMPLADRPFERGKSGYKLIQYMACGLPVVASPVGVNSQIVIDGANGFLASSEAEWRTALLRLIEDTALRAKLGKAGRNRAEQHYSLASQAPRLVELLESAGDSDRG